MVQFLDLMAAGLSDSTLNAISGGGTTHTVGGLRTQDFGSWHLCAFRGRLSCDAAFRDETAGTDNGQIVLAHIMTVTLSTNRRAVDGALGAELIATLKTLIENQVMV